MKDAGCEPLGSTPAEMASAHLERDDKFAKIVRDGKPIVE